MTCLMATTAFAAGTGDVAGAVESTWSTASTQIKSVVDNVVFPAIDLILAVFFFAKLGTAYFSTENPASSSGRLPPSCLPASCLPSLRPCISLEHHGHLRRYMNFSSKSFTRSLPQSIRTPPM